MYAPTSAAAAASTALAAHAFTLAIARESPYPPRKSTRGRSAGRRAARPWRPPTANAPVIAQGTSSPGPAVADELEPVTRRRHDRMSCSSRPNDLDESFDDLAGRARAGRGPQQRPGPLRPRARGRPRRCAYFTCACSRTRLHVLVAAGAHGGVARRRRARADVGRRHRRRRRPPQPAPAPRRPSRPRHGVARARPRASRALECGASSCRSSGALVEVDAQLANIGRRLRPRRALCGYEVEQAATATPRLRAGYQARYGQKSPPSSTGNTGRWPRRRPPACSATTSPRIGVTRDDARPSTLAAPRWTNREGRGRCGAAGAGAVAT